MSRKHRRIVRPYLVDIGTFERGLNMNDEQMTKLISYMVTEYNTTDQPHLQYSKEVRIANVISKFIKVTLKQRQNSNTDLMAITKNCSENGSTFFTYVTRLDFTPWIVLYKIFDNLDFNSTMSLYYTNRYMMEQVRRYYSAASPVGKRRLAAATRKLNRGASVVIALPIPDIQMLENLMETISGHGETLELTGSFIFTILDENMLHKIDVRFDMFSVVVLNNFCLDCRSRIGVPHIKYISCLDISSCDE